MTADGRRLSYSLVNNIAPELSIPAQYSAPGLPPLTTFPCHVECSSQPGAGMRAGTWHVTVDGRRLSCAQAPGT